MAGFVNLTCPAVLRGEMQLWYVASPHQHYKLGRIYIHTHAHAHTHTHTQSREKADFQDGEWVLKNTVHLEYSGAKGRLPSKKKSKSGGGGGKKEEGGDFFGVGLRNAAKSSRTTIDLWGNIKTKCYIYIYYDILLDTIYIYSYGGTSLGVTDNPPTQDNHWRGAGEGETLWMRPRACSRDWGKRPSVSEIVFTAYSWADVRQCNGLTLKGFSVIINNVRVLSDMILSVNSGLWRIFQGVTVYQRLSM